MRKKMKAACAYPYPHNLEEENNISSKDKDYRSFVDPIVTANVQPRT
jgi:hypothetical protein